MSKKALNVQDDSRRKGIQGNTSKSEIKCVCLNARSIINKKTELNIMVDDIKPHIIGITESWANNDIANAELGLEGYVMFRKDRIGRRGGGVLLYIKDTILAYEVQLQEEADCNDAIWCNLVTGHTTVIIGVVYRCPNITKQNNEKIHNAINEVSKGDCIIMGDFNHGNIKWDTLQSTGVEDSMFLCLVQDNFLTQHVLEPTRAARVLDIVLSSQKEFVDNVVIQEPLGSSDHNQLHFNIKIKSDETKVKQCRRDFRKGNYREIRKRLAHIDGNDKMKNKTATECWNILRGELDSAIDSFVPMKKQGKRSKKKHLSKEAFRKIRHKQNMWRVYKHTGKDQDYVVYKEALNAATNEVRKSKRNFELKLAQNIKSDSKSFYAYVRSKQNVRDKVGPLEDNAGDKITEGILMAEESIQNAAARLLTGTRKYDHITPVLRELHWLPITSRIQYKVTLLVYKTLHGPAPQYLQDLIQYRSARPGLRSAGILLNVPMTRSVTYGDRAFCSIGPTWWNSLPSELKTSPSVDSFKRNLKTHLFKLAYGQ